MGFECFSRTAGLESAGEKQLNRTVPELIENLHVNDQLLISLKKCVELLAQFKDFDPDSTGWQEMLDVFEATIGVGERVVEEKTLH